MRHIVDVCLFLAVVLTPPGMYWHYLSNRDDEVVQ